MRIGQVVTYVSADGSFGGPVSVAVAQAAALAKLGHEVQLIAGWDGRATIDAPGVEAKLFRVRRVAPGAFSGLYAPKLTAHLRNCKFDAVHIHFARDLVTLPAALAVRHCGVPYVLQPHGMVVSDARLKSRLFDAAAIRRAISSAVRVLVYDDSEGSEIQKVSRGCAKLEYLINGIMPGGLDAVARSEPPEILFMARLHPRKRVMVFLEAARALLSSRPDLKFAIVGPDEGDLAQALEFIEANRLESAVRYEGALDYAQVRRRLAKAWVYVLPSVNEPFPMTVLEAIAAGTPCVITDTCGIAPYFRRADAGIVIDGTAGELIQAIENYLSDDMKRMNIIENATALMHEYFTIDSVARRLSQIYGG